MYESLRSRLMLPLHEDDGALRSTLRSFVDSALVPLESDLDKGGPDAQARLSAASGQARSLAISPLTLPESVGGPGLPLWAQTVVREEIGFTTMAAASAVKRPPAALLEGRSAEVRGVVQGLVDGSSEVAFALSEGQSSSTFFGIQTRLCSGVGGLRLNGVKEFVSGAPSATHLLVFARDDRGEQGQLTACLVPTDAAGVSMQVRDKISWRGYPWATVTFSEVPILDGWVVGAAGDGARLAMADIARTRLGVSAHYIGTTVRILTLMSDWSEQRRIGPGVALSSRQGFRWSFSRLVGRLFAVRSLVYSLAVSDARATRAETSAAKLLASELVGDAADLAVQVFGASGLDEANVISVLYRDARAFRIGEGTTEIHLETISRHFFGEE